MNRVSGYYDFKRSKEGIALSPGKISLKPSASLPTTGPPPSTKPSKPIKPPIIHWMPTGRGCTWQIYVRQPAHRPAAQRASCNASASLASAEQPTLGTNSLHKNRNVLPFSNQYVNQKIENAHAILKDIGKRDGSIPGFNSSSSKTGSRYWD